MRIPLYILLFFFGIGGALSSCSSEENVPLLEESRILLEAETFFNVSYGPSSQQVYDLYLPAARNSEKTKVIILIHGGGWIHGDKSNMNRFITGIRENHPNHAIVNINYVLGSVTPPIVPAFPNQFLDIDAVINKLTTEKEALQILPEFALVGSSAGAHLALMYDFVYDTDDQVKFVANIVGPTNFTDPFYAKDPSFMEGLSLLVDENKYPSGINIAEATSPIFQLNSASSPAVMFYGNQDAIVPLSNGTSLDAAFSDAKITHSFTTYNGGHNDDWSEADLLNLQSQISEYIEIYLPVE